MAENDVTERWTYEGRRLDTKGKIVYKWLDGNGDSRLFTKGSTGTVIGGIYDVTVRSEGDRTYMIGRPSYTGEYVDDTLSLRLQDNQAYAHVQEARANKRMNELSEVDNFVDEIIPSIKSFDDLDALRAVIDRKLHRAYVRKLR
jgi:hypothetical protein